METCFNVVGTHFEWTALVSESQWESTGVDGIMHSWFVEPSRLREPVNILAESEPH